MTENAGKDVLDLCALDDPVPLRLDNPPKPVSC